MNALVADECTVDDPEDLTSETTAQTGFYTHRGLDEQASSIRPGVLTPDPLPSRVLENMDGPEGRHGKMRERFLSALTRLTLGLDQGFDAYLRFFREGSA